MVDERREERVVRREEPSRTGSAAIKWVSMIIITVLILFFLVYFVFPLFDDMGNEQEQDEDINVELDVDDGDSGGEGSGGDSGGGDEGSSGE